ncbi:hypothetical protein GCM10011348_30160 [Marinobacterium nitratireducens]|uniref:Photosynthesis system II assembly factor Ycf48/Hcf136-like domain-containing protein n=1 Tax=Marinobacterium nitratireducens TaxID=518897 RepID=A0A918DVR6_9GAMM|nr:YCF48-related protein [Marinobacterium nitratireducens]GGO84280.1 hypothetical protein GCM10011348_30160 [Marinobacterium nitratireducens]
MLPRQTLFIALLMAALLQQPSASLASDFTDVLDLPAMPSDLAATSPLTAITRAGARLVAVGQRGHILLSDDDGRSWQQAEVPVSSDLNAVHFATAEEGWAVGHDGVVLRSRDAGRTWERQLDGRVLGQLMLDYYSALALARPDDDRVGQLVEESKRIVAEGADKPFLDVWFENARTGYVVGAFNLILRTDDGGAHWLPQQHLTENPYALHLNAIDAAGNNLYIAGEQGLLLKRDPDTGYFRQMASSYDGSYFGLLGQPGLLLAYGLRGHLFRSTDQGERWHAIDVGSAVSLTAAAADTHGRIFLANQAGQTFVSNDRGISFAPLPAHDLSAIAGAGTAADGSLVLTGQRGIHRITHEQQKD